jgi:nonsense-mediated mRNA decay protein 3
VQVKLTIQKEVYSGVILQQVFVVELVIHNFQCTNCHMVAADNTWRAVVQCRQKVDHKRTFYLLEQLILKYKAHTQTVSVKEVPDGIDFYFLHRNHALKFQEFTLSVVPGRSKGASERVISEDMNNNKINAKFTFSMEIVPVCKDDVMCLHPRQHASLGNRELHTYMHTYIDTFTCMYTQMHACTRASMHRLETMSHIYT